MSIHVLPFLCTIHFCIVLERLFSWLTFSALWGKSWGWLPHQSRQKSYRHWNHSLSDFSYRWGRGGKWGLITAFCRIDEAKVESVDTFLTLVQHGSPKPGVVVVKAFTNTPHLPWGSFRSPYLDVTTLSAGALSAQFPLVQLHLHRLSFHSNCSSARERVRLAKSLPSPWKNTVGDLRRGALFVPPFATVSSYHLLPFH